MLFLLGTDLSSELLCSGHMQLSQLWISTRACKEGILIDK